MAKLKFQLPQIFGSEATDDLPSQLEKSDAALIEIAENIRALSEAAHLHTGEGEEARKRLLIEEERERIELAKNRRLKIANAERCARLNKEVEAATRHDELVTWARANKKLTVLRHHDAEIDAVVDRYHELLSARYTLADDAVASIPRGKRRWADGGFNAPMLITQWWKKVLDARHRLRNPPPGGAPHHEVTSVAEHTENTRRQLLSYAGVTATDLKSVEDEIGE